MIDYEDSRQHNNNSPDVTYLPNIAANPPTGEVIVLNGVNPSTSRQTGVEVQQSSRKKDIHLMFPHKVNMLRKEHL